MDVTSIQCGKKMININKVLQTTTKLVNTLQNIRKKIKIKITFQNPKIEQ